MSGILADRYHATLPVPGAAVYYEVRGTGPVLLMLAGGHGDANTMDAVADHLADRYTVVSYDRRGLSRSRLDNPSATFGLETHADDASRLLATLTAEPAFVFGNSIGALIGLDLTALHPAQVRMLVAHEPPHPALLDAAERAHAERTLYEMEQVYGTSGAIAALQILITDIGATYGELEPGVEPPRRTGEAAANLKFFFDYDLPAVRRYRLDIGLLQAATTRIRPAGGRDSRATWPYDCAVALANRLGAEIMELPSDHLGYMTHPRAYAASLREALAG
jgi:pimeloyl-ACP methyl ester carboxylesterase